MTVHFVYRCHYGNPSEKWVRRFEADTVLDWFRSIWQPIPANDTPPYRAYQHANRLLGRNVYGFDCLFEKIAEQGWDPPTSMRQLTRYLESTLYIDEMKSGPHHVQIYTDDDDLEMVIHVFDDHYAAAHPNRSAFLAHEDWKLPDGAGPGGFRAGSNTIPLLPKGPARGTTYFALLAFYASDNIDGLAGAYRLDGMRVPDLPRYLLTREEPPEGEWPGELDSLGEAVRAYAARAKGEERAFLTSIAEGTDEAASWAAYSDWLQDRGRPAGGPYLLEMAMRATEPGHVESHRQKRNDLYHVGEHIAQACKHTGTWRQKLKNYHQWIFFDDVWASGHPDLAQSLLRFAARWDVL
jgi:uncharacterized protein (TIGR02996 family)